VPRAFWRLVSKSCDECKGSFARGCEANRWSHWTCSSLGTIFQPMRINAVPDVKSFCNNKNVLRAQSMVWHFVRHPVFPSLWADFCHGVSKRKIAQWNTVTTAYLRRQSALPLKYATDFLQLTLEHTARRIKLPTHRTLPITSLWLWWYTTTMDGVTHCYGLHSRTWLLSAWRKKLCWGMTPSDGGLRSSRAALSPLLFLGQNQISLRWYLRTYRHIHISTYLTL